MLARHDVERVEARVDALGAHALHQRRVVDAVHDDQQLVEREPAAAAHHPRASSCRGPRRRSSRSPAGRPAPRGSARMANMRSRHAAVSSTRSPSRVSAPCGPKNSSSWIVRPCSGWKPEPSDCAAHADRVDLVDEHDALAAPLAREPLGLEGEVAHEHRVHADEGLREAGARDRDERAVERRRDALGEHRLAGAGGAEEEHAALALAARLLELLARLPERDHARDLLLGLGLAADVVHLDAPVRVARLVALDLPAPSSSSGPNRIRKLAKNRMKTIGR